MGIWELADLSTPFSLYVAATLRVADCLVDGPVALTALAAQTGADSDALGRVLRHLTAAGVFIEDSPGSFALNDRARELLDPGTRIVLDLDGFGGRMAGAWSSLLAAVRTGSPAYDQAFGLPFWDDLAAHPRIAAQFDDLMGVPGHGVPDPRILQREEDWDGVRTVVDVGGGTGALLTEILRARPGIRGILVDLPSTVARASLPGGALVFGQSFFDPLPPGADLYILKNVLADWPDAEAVTVLRRCAEAARPSNGKVVVSLAETASPGLLMLVLVGGKERTVEAFRPLAAQAGLAVERSGRTAGGKFMAECRPL